MAQHSHNSFHKGTHKPLTTAHLAHTMTLLRLNTDELKQKIEKELASNPALEFIEERRCPTCNQKLPKHSNCPKCSLSNNDLIEEPIVFVSPPEDRAYGLGGTKESDFTDNEFSAEPEDLATYVLRQIASELEEAQRPIAAHILSSINEDGISHIPASEVAIYHHVSLNEVEKVIRLIQLADPIGVGSSSTKDALSIQLEVLGARVPYPKATQAVINNSMDLLSKRQYSELARMHGLRRAQVKTIAQFVINNLNPFPGRSHWGNARHQSSPSPATYKRPDVIIKKQNDSGDARLIVEILWPIRGILRVNPLFKQSIKNAPEEKSSQWKKDIEQANLLVKCLGQRYHTLVRLMKRLTVIQRDFILDGDIKLLPLTRASLADELDVHEATISRAVSGKSAQLPSGKIVPLALFFDRSLHIRTALKIIISKETTPLSDTKIATQLAKKGHKIARRTVAKYRSMEGILPAHLRQGTAS